MMGMKRVLSNLVGGELPGTKTYNGHKGSIRCARFSRDGNVAASASGDHTAILWDLSSGKRCVTLGSLPNNLTGGGVGKGHSHIVSGVDFSPDGEFVCTSSYDKSLRIWRASNGEPLAVLEGHMQFVNCCRWAPDGSAILSGSSDKTLRCWRLLRDGNPDFAQFQWGNGTVLNFAFAHCNSSMQDDHQDSADYQRLTLKHRTHLPDMKCILTTLVGHQGSITSCEFSPDMRWIASTSTDLTTRIWDTQQSLDPKTADKAMRLRLTGHQKSVISCAFSPRSDVIATGSQDSTVRISRVEDGLLLREINVGSCYCTAVGFCCKDGNLLLVSTGGKKLKVYGVHNSSSDRTLQSAGRGVDTFDLRRLSGSRQDLLIGGGDHSMCHVPFLSAIVDKTGESFASSAAASPFNIRSAIGYGDESLSSPQLSVGRAREPSSLSAGASSLGSKSAASHMTESLSRPLLSDQHHHEEQEMPPRLDSQDHDALTESLVKIDIHGSDLVLGLPSSSGENMDSIFESEGNDTPQYQQVPPHAEDDIASLLPSPPTKLPAHSLRRQSIGTNAGGQEPARVMVASLE